MRIVIFLTATLLFTQILTQEDENAGQVEGIPDPEILVRSEEYAVSLEHLCPQAPSEEAAQCLSSFRNSQRVTQTLLTSVKNVDYSEQYGKFFQLTECSIKKVPKINFNLNVYCYFKGVREFILKDFAEIESMEEFNEMLAALIQMIEDETRPDFKAWFQQVLNMLQVEHSEMLQHDEGFRANSDLEVSMELGKKFNPDLYVERNKQ